MIIYINSKNIQLNEQDGASRPVVVVDDTEDIMNGSKEVYNVRIGKRTRIVYDPDGHWRGPHVWIETDEKITYDETP